MQKAEIPSRLVPEPTPARPAVSPPLAFAILLAVIAAIGTIVLLTRPAAPAPPSQATTQQPPDFSLTNEEAITRFEELQALVAQAYATQDTALLSSAYVTGSPIGTIAAKEVRKLTRDGVFDRTTFETKSVRVTSNESEEIRLTEVVLVTPKFEDPQGNDLTTQQAPVRQTVEWTLRLDNSEWLLYDALVTKADPVR